MYTYSMYTLVAVHSDLKCPITFGNWFWHLTVGNRPIVLNFYQQRPVFALKNCPRPQRPKKANEGQQRPAKSKTLNFFVIITIQCKIINKCKYNTKKMCFKEIWNFHFHYINFLKLHFVEYVKFSKSFQWNNGTGSFICIYVTWKKWKIIHKFPPTEIKLNIWWKSLHRKSRYCQNHQNGVTSCFPKMVIKWKQNSFSIELSKYRM